MRVLRELRALFEEALITLESQMQANLAWLHLFGPMVALIYVMHLLACRYTHARVRDAYMSHTHVIHTHTSRTHTSRTRHTHVTHTRHTHTHARTHARTHRIRVHDASARSRSFVAVAKKAIRDGYESSWLIEYHDGDALDNPSRMYVIALYWASGTSTGLGTAVIPANEYEWLFVSLAHAMGMVLMGSVIGWIGRVIENSQSPIEKMIDSKTDVVKDITRWRRMPPSLADQVIRFYGHYCRKHAAFDEKELIEALGLAPSLRRDVFKHLLGQSVALVPMLSKPKYATDEFQLAADQLQLLKPIIYEPREVLIRQYATSSTLLFLNDGTLRCSTTISSQPRMLYTIREQGDLCGEHALLDKPCDVEVCALRSLITCH